MGEESDDERLRRLGEQISRIKGSVDPARTTQSDAQSQSQAAWRMVSELVAGLLVGFGIGYGLDALFGTRPWLMLLFATLGFVAGVRALMRTAQDMQRTLVAEAERTVRGNAASQDANIGPGGKSAKGQRGDTRRG